MPRKATKNVAEKPAAPKPYLNLTKYIRTKAVVDGTRTFAADSVEFKALNKAKSEKLEGTKLFDRVYTLIGGAIGE